MAAITISLRSRGPLRVAAVAACLLLPWLAAARAEMLCPAAPLPPLHLPHLHAAVERGAEAVIVAIGSSSTEGAMASDSGHTYPAVLQATLARALPQAHIAVLNRGIGGQDAPEELARLQADVIDVHPQVAIWQVGANGALRNADPLAFRHTVAEGVRLLRAAGIDVVLMDNQHAPRVDATAEHAVLNEMLAEVAETTGANLFSRSRLMEQWGQLGAPPIEFVAADGLHHNNRGYACLARAMADEIVTALHGPRAIAANR